MNRKYLKAKAKAKAKKSSERESAEITGLAEELP